MSSALTFYPSSHQTTPRTSLCSACVRCQPCLALFSCRQSTRSWSSWNSRDGRPPSLVLSLYLVRIGPTWNRFIYTTTIEEFVCPPNISETVAVSIMKLAHRPCIASTTIKLISKPILLSILLKKTIQWIGTRSTPNIAHINLPGAGRKLVLPSGRSICINKIFYCLHPPISACWHGAPLVLQMVLSILYEMLMSAGNKLNWIECKWVCNVRRSLFVCTCVLYMLDAWLMTGGCIRPLCCLDFLEDFFVFLLLCIAVQWFAHIMATLIQWLHTCISMRSLWPRPDVVLKS